jgi:uncharacterized protein
VRAADSKIDIASTELSELLAILRQWVPDRVVLAFGSRVTGNAKKFSDLDLAILGNEPLSSNVLANLADAFDESALPFKVDIVDWNTTNESFKKIIEQHAVPVDHNQ